MTTKTQTQPHIDNKPIKNKGGRPPKYGNVRELKVKVKAYFDFCDANNRMPEKAGLCKYLGINRDTYCRFKKKKAFSDTLKDAESWIESAWVQRLGDKAQSAGAIFYLKNAFKEDFKDRHETDITSKGEQIKIYIPERK